MPDGFLLDTSFFIRLLKEDDPLFQNANDYYRYFLQNNLPIFISTISIAEFCVKGSPDELPLKNLIVIPFNYNHAITAGKFASILYDRRKNYNLKINERPIIINDAKLFAQVHEEKKVNYFVTADERSLKLYENINNGIKLNFEFIHIGTKYNETFGILDL